MKGNELVWRGKYRVKTNLTPFQKIKLLRFKLFVYINQRLVITGAASFRSITPSPDLYEKFLEYNAPRAAPVPPTDATAAPVPPTDATAAPVAPVRLFSPPASPDVPAAVIAPPTSSDTPFAIALNVSTDEDVLVTVIAPY